MAQAQALVGRSVWDVAQAHRMPVPNSLAKAKGWSGALLEHVLGGQAGSRAMPDFPDCGLELKTVPVNAEHMPQQTTYVTACPAQVAGDFEHSIVASKLRHVLWIPLIDVGLGPLMRVIGEPRQSGLEGAWGDQIRCDWDLIAQRLCAGQWDRIDARLGTYLHVRPKGQNSRHVMPVCDAWGQTTWTLKRGFYLRVACTRCILLPDR